MRVWLPVRFENCWVCTNVAAQAAPPVVGLAQGESLARVPFDRASVTSELVLEDVRLALEEMNSFGLSMEVAEAVGRLWEVVIRDIGADSDFTAAIKPIEKKAGVVVGGAKGGIAGK